MLKVASFSILLALSSGFALADQDQQIDKCSCSKECKAKCEKGKALDCLCKECECAKSDHCKK